ncbi:MAG TPA: S41 family peptidase [Gemmatimonadaceae bacterium]|jgi:carboxyl-terminal processing protease|nr:S41 family peptidase [Gemmatimonadaceae bacterium]
MPTKHRFSRPAVAAAILIPLCAGAFIIQHREAVDGAHLLDQVLQLTASRYVDTMPEGDLYEKAARGLVRELNDPYTVLFTPKEYGQFNQQTGGEYGGIGMEIAEVEGFVTVQQVFPHTPAAAGGVAEGDRIVQIDTTNVRGWTTQQVSDKLKGKPGTAVNVSFERDGVAEPIPLTFTRSIVHIPAVPFTLVLDGNVGYVPLQQFSETAAQELNDAVAKVTKEGATRLVVDLRGNPGGILDQAIATSNIFLQKGQEIASVRGRGGDAQTFTATEMPQQPSIPMVVLVDGHSASAAEILSGALQDHDRALIVGTTTFGKGLVQSLFQLDGGYALKMTTAKWYTPSGRSIQKARKLLPDGEFVEVTPDSLESDSVKRARPKFKSDAGRIVYGGGGITPDIIVKPDTLSTAEQKLIASLAAKQQIFAVQLQTFALEHRGKLSPNFTVTPALRNEFVQRLRSKGMTIDPALLASGGSELDRILESRLASAAFGDSTAKRKALADDNQLVEAIAVLKKVPNQAALFNVAQRETDRTVHTN